MQGHTGQQLDDHKAKGSGEKGEPKPQPVPELPRERQSRAGETV